MIPLVGREVKKINKEEAMTKRNLNKLQKLEDLYIQVYEEKQAIKERESNIKDQIESLIGEDSYTGTNLKIGFTPRKERDTISIVDVRNDPKLYKKLKKKGIVKTKVDYPRYRYTVKKSS